MPSAGKQVTGQVSLASVGPPPATARAARASTPLPQGPAQPLVVIVASTRAEQARLIAGLPDDVAVLVTPTVELAEAILHDLPPVLSMAEEAEAPVARLVPGPVPVRLSVLAAERSVGVGDRVVRLTPLEFALLRVLTSETGRVWSFAELIQRIWGTAHVGDGAQVRAVVKRLRRKLAEVQAPVSIETIRAAGFRLVETSRPGGED